MSAVAVFGKKPAARRRVAPLLLLLLATGVASPDALGDTANGARVAEQCVSCHGARGISSGPVWPNLRGQKAEYMVKQLREFKSGIRKDPMMNLLVQSMTEQDMRDVSVYFATLE